MMGMGTYSVLDFVSGEDVGDAEAGVREQVGFRLENLGLVLQPDLRRDYD
jgi:hypothetical protein